MGGPWLRKPGPSAESGATAGLACLEDLCHDHSSGGEVMPAALVPLGAGVAQHQDAGGRLQHEQNLRTAGEGDAINLPKPA